jgi:hypothetical protein
MWEPFFAAILHEVAPDVVRPDGNREKQLDLDARGRCPTSRAVRALDR